MQQARLITKLKKVEEALRYSEEQFRAMFKKHHSVMLLIDPENGQIIGANQSAEKYYGYSAAEMKKMNIQQINQLAEEEIFSEMANAKAQNRNYFHFLHKLATHEIRHVEVHSSPIPFRGKTILFSIVYSTTISLCLSLYDWAKFRKKKDAIKLHTLLNYDGCLPVYMNMTDGKVHDAKAFKEIKQSVENYIIPGYLDQCGAHSDLVSIKRHTDFEVPESLCAIRIVSVPIVPVQ